MSQCVVCGGPLDGDFKEICRACFARAKAPPVRVPELTPVHLFALSAGKGLVDLISYLMTMPGTPKRRGPKDWRPGEKPPVPKTAEEARAELGRILAEIRGKDKPEDGLPKP